MEVPSVHRSTHAGEQGGDLAEEHFGVHEQHEVHDAPCHSRVNIARPRWKEDDLPNNKLLR